MIEVMCYKNEKERLLQAVVKSDHCIFNCNCNYKGKEYTDCRSCIADRIKWSIKE